MIAGDLKGHRGEREREITGIRSNRCDNEVSASEFLMSVLVLHIGNIRLGFGLLGHGNGATPRVRDGIYKGEMRTCTQ